MAAFLFFLPEKILLNKMKLAYYCGTFVLLQFLQLDSAEVGFELVYVSWMDKENEDHTASC